MFGSRYNGDVTGDGPSQAPSRAQEQAALMHGSRYDGDVTGDGAALSPPTAALPQDNLTFLDVHRDHELLSEDS
jgi:hypothetical protein